MKILLFHTYNNGYLSRFFHEILIRLSQEGHEVVSFTWKRSVSDRIIDGVRVIVKKKKGYFTNYYNVWRIINRENPDVILSNFSYVNPALLFGKLYGVPKNMVWFHSLNAQMASSKMQIFIKKQFLKLADVVIANSYLTKKELHSSYTVPKHKMKVIPFWSNITSKEMKPSSISFSAARGVLKIGCPGRITNHKNQKILIETLSVIKNTTDTNFQLYVAGDGEALSDLKQQVATLALKDHVHFLNHLSANDMLHFYTNMDVVVLPSLHEAFGLVFIEAISLGTPVIVSSAFGALSFIQEDEQALSAFTFDPESSDDLLKKLNLYLKEEGLSKEYFSTLYQRNFDKEVIFKNILKTIKTA
ncbi:glycosyltransferase family 4 protein [Lacinutrix cladophorae]